MSEDSSTIMGWLTIRNWDKWQTYRKDRQQPPWIKLHRSLMRDPDWISLSDSQRGHLISIWMLAADRDGRIPDDPKVIQKMCFLDRPPDLKLLMAHKFLDATLAPGRQPVGCHGDAPEESRGEIERDTHKRGSQVEEDWQPKEKTVDSLKASSFLGSQISSELEKFRLHHRSKGSVFKDKDAAFRKWMMNVREWGKANGGTAATRPTGGSFRPVFKPEPEIAKPSRLEREAQVARLLRAEIKAERESSP